MSRAQLTASLDPTVNAVIEIEFMSYPWIIETLLEGGALQATVVLAQNGEETMLVDSGYPRQEKQLLAALAQRGLSADSITHVVNTHLHFDHSHNNCLFTRSKVVCSQREFEWMTDLCERLMSKSVTLDALFKYYPELKAYENDPKVIWSMVRMVQRFWVKERLGRPEQFLWLEDGGLPDGMKSIHTPGHVPFHYSFTFETDRGPVLVAGDAMITRNKADQDAMTFPPTDRSLYEETKKKLIGFEGIIVPGHDAAFGMSPHPSAGQ
jgi:glyoxylase-like metal-dependent hydrolase (beta-lactamase superfamily II)